MLVCFPHRGCPLAFAVKFVWWCWILLAFCLFVKLLISLSNLNESSDGLNILGGPFLPFITWNISCYSIVACRVSTENSADNLMGFPLCHLFLLSFVFIFNILSLFFFNLINMCWSVHPWVHPLWHSLHFLYLSVYFLYCVREVLTYNIFIFFLRLFLFCSPSETSITGMLVHLVLSQRSLILS